jgi:hypothetical protein
MWEEASRRRESKQAEECKQSADEPVGARKLRK